MTNIESLRLITEAVETAGADIAPTYAEYVQLAFAIATDCGEAGREFFHRLCRISAKYQSAHAERMFSNALTKQQGAIHLGTAFHLAESTGVKICREDRKKVMNNRTGTVGTESSPHNFSTHAHVYNKVEEEKSESEELLEGSDPHHPLPTFTLEDWPKLLLRIISYGTTVTQKDVLLLGALTALGATMERYVRCHYAGKYQSPCMQSFIVAPAASGKGVLSLIRLLVMPIHDDIRQQVEKEMNVYKKAKVAYEMMGKERAKAEIPEMPLNRMFLISGNNTGTGILQNIMDNNGTGLICETEADTISTAIGSEYGHWSETLRRAFDHDWLAYNRRTNQEYRENKKSYLSLLLSGTPAQVKPLIPSVENGLFSRQLFYYMHGIYQWINQFDENETDLEAIFTSIGLEWKKLLNLLKEHGLHTLRLTDEQKQEFNDLFSDFLCLLQIFRMFCLNCHKLINSIVNSFLDTSSCIQFFYWNEFVNFFIHAFCTVITISYSVSKYFVFFVKKNEVNAPGINTHTYRNLADFFTFFKTSNDFCKNSVEFPTEFSVFLNHTIFETMDFFKFHLSVFHVSKNQTSTGCAHIYCCIICCHC